MRPTRWFRELPKLPGFYIITFEGVDGFKVGKFSSPERMLSYCRPWNRKITKVFVWQFTYDTVPEEMSENLDTWGEYKSREFAGWLERLILDMIPAQNKNGEFVRRDTSNITVATVNDIIKDYLPSRSIFCGFENTEHDR